MSDTVFDRDVTSKPANVLHAWYVGVVVVLANLAACFFAIRMAWRSESVAGNVSMGLVSIFLVFLLFSMLSGFLTLQPYQRLVVSLFGSYVGVENREGLSWMAPWYAGREVSTALRNFETETVKVNDHSGNPVMLSAVVVHRIVDPAKAVYVVGNAEQYVEQQVLAGIRSLAAQYDYDDIAPKKALSGTDLEKEASTTPLTLRGDIEEIAGKLKQFVQERIGDVGVEIVEARFVHLAYSSEIASAMLKRQQATAVIAARELIVEGALGIVEHALTKLSEKGMTLDEDRRATIASNLLVVLVSDHGAAPVMPLGMS
jgi:regulator of protease activity HflC (stomatin/prohibitin superfamily)